jgi:hypothetical protein
MKTEVYSWRVSADRKTDLEREARRRKISLSAALDLATQEWLTKSNAGTDEEAQQQRLRQAASECFGVLASGDARRSECVRQTVRQRLRRRYDR